MASDRHDPPEPVLTGRPLGHRGLELRPRNPRLPGREFQDWKSIVAQVVDFAYAGRDLCVIEIESNKPLLPSLAIDVVRRVKGRGLLAGFFAHCSSDLLAELSGSTEFDVGWLWLTSLRSGDDDRLARLISAVDASHAFHEVPETSEQLLLMVYDSEAVWWLNPARPFDDVLAQAGEIARSVGWRFNATLLRL
jgi:hypothetical protein